MQCAKYAIESRPGAAWRILVLRMAWTALSRLDRAILLVGALVGLGGCLLWWRTHHLDPRHGAMHLLIGSVMIVTATGGALVADMLLRRRGR